MEAVQAPPPMASEAAKPRNPDDRNLNEEASAASGSSVPADGGGENGSRVSINGKDGFVEIVRTRLVQTHIFDVSGTEYSGVGDSEIDGVRSLLKMKGSRREVEGEDGHGDSGSFHGVPDVDPVAEIGVEEIKDVSAAMGVWEDDTEERDDLFEEGHKFAVGDFIWGKIKSHPWWPGQIYDPSDASESAAKLNQKGRLLVAFSDGTFAWCHPSQLKPFEENFEEMLKHSSSKSFVTAVENTLIDMSKLMELGMSCSCVRKGNQEGLGWPLADNTGIREGVFVPEGGIRKFTIEPAEFIANLRNVARVASVPSMLDLLKLKSVLSAFCRAKGVYELAVYYEPQQIPGLEDKTEEGVMDMVIYDGAIDVPVQGPFAEDWLSIQGPPGFGDSSPTVLQLQNFPGTLEDKLHEGRKQKSIAEIIAKEGTGSGKLTSGRKKRKARDAGNGDDNLISIPTFATPESKILSENEAGQGNLGTKKRGRKRKEGNGDDNLISVPTFATPESKILSENEADQGSQGPKRRGRKRKEGSGTGVGGGKVVKENGHVPTEKKVNSESKEQIEKGHASRERKKSKYLSPPYTSPSHGLRKEELEAESLKVADVAQVGEGMTKAAGHIIEYSPIVNSGVETLQTSLSKKVCNGRDSLSSSSPQAPKQVKWHVIAKLPVTVILSEIRSAALYSLYQGDQEARDIIGEFLNGYRDSTYLYRLNNAEHKQQQQPSGKTKSVSSQQRPGRKRKSMNSELGSLTIDLTQNGHNVLVSQSESQKRGFKNSEAAKLDKPKPRRSAGASDLKTNGEETGSASLFVTFGPGSSLPTKDALIAIYSNFGDLIEDETDMFYNNFCARIVFVRSSDAEEAFNSSQEVNPFGAANVTFRLRYPSAASKAGEFNETSRTRASSFPNLRNKNTGKSSTGEATLLNFVKEKLEVMTTMLGQSDEKISPDLKSKLEGEMRGLLGKVSAVVGSSA